MTDQNTRIVLRERPTGLPGPEHFDTQQVAVASPGSGQVRVEVLALGIDAFIATTLTESGFHRRTGVGDPIAALGVGVVEASEDPSLSGGDVVVGPLGAQTISVVSAAALRKIDVDAVDATRYLGPLGMTTGVTAYVGMRFVGQVADGDTVVVSAAAGAVGSMAAQVAKLSGARVIGIAGGPRKSAYLTDELGLAGAIDYKNEDVAAKLRELAPDGVDVFFDNVGNPILDIVLDQLAERARVVICGAIANYGNMDAVSGPTNYLKLAERQARMEGFTVLHFTQRWPEAEEQLGRWLAAGELVATETVIEGIEQFPEAVAMLFNGSHIGKLLVRP